jgi:transposase-like protein
MTTNDPQRTRALTLLPAAIPAPAAPAAPAARPERPEPVRADPERQERAFALHLAGYRTGQIAEQFHVTTRAVRYWLRDKREEAAKEALAERPNRLTRAIESQRLIAAAAWSAYEDVRDRERAAASGQLDLHARRILRPAGRRITDADPAPGDLHPADLHPADLSDESVIEDYRRPRYSAQIAKFLAIAAAAQREIARLQGLYDPRPHEDQPADDPTDEPTDEPADQPADDPDAPSAPRSHLLQIAAHPSPQRDRDAQNAKAEGNGKASPPADPPQPPIPPASPTH